jgi:hypothetical protein
MSEWLVQLTGEEVELETVTRLFNLPELRIIKEDRDYFLQSEDFRPLSDARDVYKCAQKMLPFINGAARLHSVGFKQIAIDVIVQLNEDGTRSSTGFLTATIEVRSSVELNTRTSPTQPTSVEEWVTLANTDQKAAKTLRLLGTREQSWAELYKLYEIVHSDVGNKVFENGWATRNKIKLFTHTANSAGAVGDDARHAKEDSAPPPSPMPLLEAQTLIRRLVMRWLRSKV